MTNQEKILRLRIELYTAAQMLEGQDLRDFEELITEIVQAIDIRSRVRSFLKIDSDLGKFKPESEVTHLHTRAKGFSRSMQSILKIDSHLQDEGLDPTIKDAISEPNLFLRLAEELRKKALQQGLVATQVDGYPRREALVAQFILDFISRTIESILKIDPIVSEDS